MNFKINKIIKKVILVTVCTIFLLMIILSFNDITAIFETLKTIDVKYFWIALGVSVLYLLIWPIPLCILTKAKKAKISMVNTYMIGGTEIFFNGITPFSSGGQPFQVYCFNDKGVKASESTGILLMNFIVYQIVVNLFCVVAFILYFNQLNLAVSNLKYLIIIGFSVNLIVLFFFMALSTMKIFRKILVKFMYFLCKSKLIAKFLEKRIPAFELYFDDAQAAFKEVLKHKFSFFLSMLFRIIGFILYYAIPFYVLKAMGVAIGYDQLMFVIAMTSFALTMVIWLPTPGSSGGIELAFKVLFGSIVGVTDSIAFGGMLIWRLLTYYLLMFLSFIFYLILQKNYEKKHKEEIEANDEVIIQKDNIEEIPSIKEQEL